MLSDGVDVVVIGGGITGCGIALDAVQRGLRVVLVERGDIASGTSSRSSKLIHGGLRYLKQMQFRITRLACRERDRMLHLSPHLVRPVRFVYPAFRGDRTPGWQVDLGLSLYDRLTDRPEKHTRLDADEVAQVAPGLLTDELDRALAYTDAVADDARLTLAVAATAAAHGAGILTRCELVEAQRDRHGYVTGVMVRDLIHDTPRQVSAHVVVNATGVWTDEVRDRLGLEGSRLRPSRGIHLILPHDAVPIQCAVSLPSPDDGRPVFLIPHPEGVLLGTTDLYYDGDLDDPRPTHDEVDYLLRAVTAAFPTNEIGRDRVVGAFAGLRPILDSHADEPSDASREEDIWFEYGILSVAGGKLTTWRSTAEETVDAIVERLPEDRVRYAGPCATKGTPLAGVAPADLAAQLALSTGIEESVASAMARRLGGLAWHAAALAKRRRELKPITDGSDLCAAEVRAHLRWGAVLHLEDLLLRRVRIGMWQPARIPEFSRRVRSIVRSELGWNGARWAAEEEHLSAAVEGWTLAGCRD